MTNLIEKRMNAVLDAASHELRIRTPDMTEEEEKLAIVGALGGLVIAMQRTMGKDAQQHGHNLALHVADQLHGVQPSSLVDVNGQPFRYKA